jgi:hypothetical protein
MQVQIHEWRAPHPAPAFNGVRLSAKYAALRVRGQPAQLAAPLVRKSG